MLFNRLSKLNLLVFLSVSALPISAFAGGDTGLYLGVGMGPSVISTKDQVPAGGNFDFNESDTGTKVFAGYNFGWIPLLDLAIEGSYVDFGKPSSTLSGGTNVQYQLTGWDVFGLVGGNLGPIGIFGKVGLIAWNNDTTIGSTVQSDSGNDSAYGVGLKFQIMSLAARLEYEYFDVTGLDDVHLATVSLAYTF